MNARTRWSVLVVMLYSLLAFTTFAAAECAWVLWTQQSDVPGWLLIAASPTVAGCTKQLDIREGEARRAHEARLRSDGQSTWLINRETQTVLFVKAPWEKVAGGSTYKCFPDTMDPRGPKGK